MNGRWVVEETAGRCVPGDKKLQREGKRDERFGSLENKTDDATDAVHDKVDEVIENVSDKQQNADKGSTS